MIVNVTPVNDKPQASNATLYTDEDKLISFNLIGEDVDEDVLTYYMVTHPTKGKLTITESTGNCIYSPYSNENGIDTFTFKTNDSIVDSNTASISIVINQVNDPPVANAGESQIVYEGTEVILDSSKSFDIESKIGTYFWAQISGIEVTLLNRDQVKSSFIAPKTTKEDLLLTFQLTITDSENLKSYDNISVTVKNINIKGDINDDKIVDIKDAIILLKDLSGSKNIKGKNELKDIIYIMQIIAIKRH